MDHQARLRATRDADHAAVVTATAAREALHQAVTARQAARADLHAAVRAAREDGMTLRAIGEALGITAQGVSSLLRHMPD